jgi:hypothetical protein
VFLVMTPAWFAMCNNTLFRAMSSHNFLAEMALPLALSGCLVIVSWLCWVFAVGPDMGARFATDYSSKLGCMAPGYGLLNATASNVTVGYNSSAHTSAISFIFHEDSNFKSLYFNCFPAYMIWFSPVMCGMGLLCFSWICKVQSTQYGQYLADQLLARPRITDENQTPDTTHHTPHTTHSPCARSGARTRCGWLSAPALPRTPARCSL